MIVLDTNVVSEPIRQNSEAAVTDWLNRQSQFDLYLTAVSISEMLLGIYLLPQGRRRRELHREVTQSIQGIFGPRILHFDDVAAKAYARIVSSARSIGQVIKMADGQIAAIAAVNGFAVAARDTQPFLAAGLQVINPWTD